jgi:hypothetical protein
MWVSSHVRTAAIAAPRIDVVNRDGAVTFSVKDRQGVEVTFFFDNLHELRVFTTKLWDDSMHSRLDAEAYGEDDEDDDE